jgi:hypothetical protein
MDKIITRFPKLQARQKKAYKYELTRKTNEENISLPNEINNNGSHNLDNSNEPKKIIESAEFNILNPEQGKLVQKDEINISKPLIIENYAEVLIQKLLTQKLRNLNSNKADFPYYYHGGL